MKHNPVTAIKKKMSHMGIKWKIFGGFAVFTCIILLLLWVFQISLLNSFYRHIKIREIKNSAQTIKSCLDSKDLGNKVLRLAQNTQISVLISDETGQQALLVSATPNTILKKFSFLDLSHVYEETQKSGGTFFQRYTAAGEVVSGSHDSEEQQMPESIIYALTTTTRDGHKRLLMLNSSLSPIDSTVQTLRVQLWCLTFVMLILAFFLALYLSRKLSYPIIQINEAAKNMAGGNYNIQFNENGYREISELGRTLNYTAQELSKVENLRRDLIANVSHDLRTPLTMITGYSEVMRDIPGENTPENVQIIIDESKRLTTLVNDMLDLSKMQAGVISLDIRLFNLTEDIRSILSRYDKLADYHFTFKAENDIWVEADELKISQVIYNLINNAINYTGADKTVSVEQKMNNGYVRIEISDTGDGIEPDKLKDIWERYYKVDKSHKRAQVGSGLGLSIVKNILDMHSGEYGVRSQVGKGSTFWFELKPSCSKTNHSSADE